MSNNENQWIVHVYAVARVPIAVARDKATTPEEAIAKAVEAFYENRGLRSVIVDRPDDPMAPEDGEEITGFCVDHPGDTEYQGSQGAAGQGVPVRGRLSRVLSARDARVR